MTDAEIKEKAQFFVESIEDNETLTKLDASNWLEIFKQKNNILREVTAANSPTMCRH